MNKQKIFFSGWIALLTMIFVFLFPPVPARAEEGVYAIYPEAGMLEDSFAYEQYLLRPQSEHSKLLFLIDRFGAIDADVLYDGIHYRTDFIAPFARIFLARSYRNETAREWVMKWCNRSIRRSELLWADLPNKEVKLAREILLTELDALEASSAKVFLTDRHPIEDGREMRIPPVLSGSPSSAR
jgi:hypothetical protein